MLLIFRPSPPLPAAPWPEFRLAEGNLPARRPMAVGHQRRHRRGDAAELYRSQVVLREAEQRAYDLFLQNLVKGTSHLSLGQEAIAAGFAGAMKPGDLSFCTYRGHAHTLARGVPVEKVLGELMQRDNGLMRGKGGSMHLTSAEHGVMGSYAIIGAHLPIACGAAWRAQYKGDKDVVGLLLRRRHHQHRRVPRGAEFRRGLEAAGDLRVREQSLHGIHADRRRHRGRASGRRPRLGLRAAAHRDRRQRRRRGLSRGARRLRQGARRRRAVADRVHDLSPQRPFARRPGASTGPRASSSTGRSATRSRSIASGCKQFGIGEDVDRGDRGRREPRASTTATEKPARPRRCRRSISCPPTSTPTEAGHGGTDLSRRGRARHRAGDDARSRRGLPRRGRRQGRRRVQGDGRAATSSSAPLRVRDTPISEQAILGAAMGAAMTGPEADRRDHVLGFLRGVLRLHRQRVPEEPLHVATASSSARWWCAPATARARASARSIRRASRTGR